MYNFYFYMVKMNRVGAAINDFIEKYIIHQNGRELENKVEHDYQVNCKNFNPDIGNFILSYYFKRAEEYRETFTKKTRVFSPKRLEKKIFNGAIGDTKEILKYVIEINNQYETARAGQHCSHLDDLFREKSENPNSTMKETNDRPHFSNYWTVI